MELRHLRYFVAVAEALSFRKAAGRLSVSEPAVSQQVADLEGELGLKLFNRDSRRVELTEVGRVFCAEPGARSPVLKKRWLRLKRPLPVSEAGFPSAASAR
jgi:Bacterial regulatory helix-turn-helix protein, lysR family